MSLLLNGSTGVSSISFGGPLILVLPLSSVSVFSVLSVIFFSVIASVMSSSGDIVEVSKSTTSERFRSDGFTEIFLITSGLILPTILN